MFGSVSVKKINPYFYLVVAYFTAVGGLVLWGEPNILGTIKHYKKGERIEPIHYEMRVGRTFRPAANGLQKEELRWVIGARQYYPDELSKFAKDVGKKPSKETFLAFKAEFIKLAQAEIKAYRDGVNLRKRISSRNEYDRLLQELKG